MKKNRLVDFGNVATLKDQETTEVNKDMDISTNNGTNINTNTDTNVITNEDVNTSTDADIKDDTELNVNNDINTEINTDTDTRINVSKLLEKIASKNNKQKKIQRSIYLSEDISKKFDRYGKKMGKGAKSDLIEDFLREALKDF